MYGVIVVVVVLGGGSVKCKGVHLMVYFSTFRKTGCVLSLYMDLAVIYKQVTLVTYPAVFQLLKWNLLEFSPTDKVQGLFKKLANLSPPRGFS